MKSKTGVSVAPQKGLVSSFFFFTIRNEVAKVMFLDVSVHGRGGLPQCMLGYHPHPPGADGCCGGRYASYWNALRGLGNAVLALFGTFLVITEVSSKIVG